MKLASKLAPLVLLAYTSTATASVTPASSDELTSVLLRSGLSPEALAASGVDSTQVGGIVDSVELFMNEATTTIGALDASYASARRDRDELQRLVRSGLGSASDVQALAAAETALQSASQARESLLSDAFDAGTDGLSAGIQATLATLEGNEAWKLPVPYRAVDRTEAEWVALRDALANLSICEEMGDDPDGACVDLVADEDAKSAVATAEVNLETKLAAVKAAWDAAVANAG